MMQKEIVLLIIIAVLIINGFIYFRQSTQEETILSTFDDMPFKNHSTLLTAWVTKTTPFSTSFQTPQLNNATNKIKFTASSTASLKQDNLPIQSTSKCNTRLTSRSPDDGKWYDFTTPELTFYAYTAFVDDRPSLLTKPVVRIIALADQIEVMNPKPSMFCRFHYLVNSKGELFTLENNQLASEASNTSQNLQSTDATSENLTAFVDVEFEMNPIRNIGMGWNLNKKLAREYIFTCPIPSLAQLRRNKLTNIYGAKISNVKSNLKIPLPASVGVVIGKASLYHNVTSCLPVERPSKPAVKKDFVLCVQVAFDRIDPMRLIEWLELQSLMGVQSIGIYDQRVQESAMVVLRHYAHLGLVDLRKSDYIPDGSQQYLLHGSPVINDCMFRNLHSAKFMLVYDIDEVILPRIENMTSLNKTTPLKVLLEKIETKYGKGPFQYMFRNSYFFLDIPPDANEPKELVFLKHKQNVPLSPYGYSTKSIIDQRTCIQMHNHYCWGKTKEYDHIPSLDVDTTLAKIHHYKKCHFSTEECKIMINKAAYDDSVMPYKDELVKKVKLRVKQIQTKLKQSNIKDFLAGYF